MKTRTVAAVVIICISLLFASPGHSRVSIHFSAPAPVYVLKAWQIADGNSDEYLWSIEGLPDQGSTGILYKSLTSPSLRARVSRFEAGTKLSLRWEKGGALSQIDWNKELLDFRAFCESKGVQFNFSVTTD